jgi:hypothetical protein
MILQQPTKEPTVNVRRRKKMFTKQERIKPRKKLLSPLPLMK